MAAVTTTVTFADGDQVTSAKLNEIISGTTVVAGAITGTTLAVSAGQLKVGTITSAEMAEDSVATAAIQALGVTTAKIADENVTTAKIADANVTIGKLATTAFPAQADMEAETGSLLATPDVLKYSPVAVKAYGVFPTVTSDRTMTVSRGATVVRTASTVATVTLSPAMDSADYVVMLSHQSTGTTDGSSNSTQVISYNHSASGFVISHPSENTDRGVSFVVYGTLA